MKPKHLPRLWCAMQGLLPLGLASTKWVDLPGVLRVAHVPKISRPPLLRKKGSRTR